MRSNVIRVMPMLRHTWGRENLEDMLVVESTLAGNNKSDCMLQMVASHTPCLKQHSLPTGQDLNSCTCPSNEPRVGSVQRWRSEDLCRRGKNK